MPAMFSVGGQPMQNQHALDGVAFRDGMGRRFATSPDGVQPLHLTRAGGQGVLSLREPAPDRLNTLKA